MIKRMKYLIKRLNEASYAYYALDDPFMTDKEYDALYDELEALENESGIIIASSPTQKVQGYVLDGYKKVKHDKPMLSAQKTKDVAVIKEFVGNKLYYGSYKLDGLTLVVKYKDGKFVQGITRGNGEIGEDVTEQCRFIKNLPMAIPYQGELTLRGECLVNWEEFERVNSTLETPFKHPRSLAAGTLRNLDLTVVRDRNLEYLVFECVTDVGIDSKLSIFEFLIPNGFETVDWAVCNNLDDIVKMLSPEKYEYPTDGVIFEFDSKSYSKSLGATSHHEACRMALKWQDEEFETVITDIEWTMGKTGALSPVAVFEPVEIDGTTVNRASVHNVSILTNLDLQIGDTVTVYKANMIIPQIAKNLSAEHRESTYIKIPSVCPICGGNTRIQRDNSSDVLVCDNPYCKGKILGKMCHFVSKDAMNIEGLSEATLGMLIDKGWIGEFHDIYSNLSYQSVYSQWINLDGFGMKSVDKIYDAIEKSRTTTLDRIINAVSIPNVGKSTAKDIAKFCHGDIDEFKVNMKNPTVFMRIDGIGETIVESLKEWRENNWVSFIQLCRELKIVVEETSSSNKLVGKNFVITGSLNKFKNRSEVVAKIEQAGGKVVGSVSKNTHYLVNNDINSDSSKNKKAKQLGIPIITEDQLIELLG